MLCAGFTKANPSNFTTDFNPYGVRGIFNGGLPAPLSFWLPILKGKWQALACLSTQISVVELKVLPSSSLLTWATMLWPRLLRRCDGACFSSPLNCTHAPTTSLPSVHNTCLAGAQPGQGHAHRHHRRHQCLHNPVSTLSAPTPHLLTLQDCDMGSALAETMQVHHHVHRHLHDGALCAHRHQRALLHRLWPSGPELGQVSASVLPCLQEVHASNLQE